jgi:flagellar basal-body rod modification protein FlgD
MQVTGINAVAANDTGTTASTSSSTSTSAAAISQDDFFKLLITQLQNQDPMQPMEDKDFLAQMAQFNSLQQLETVSKSMDTLLSVSQLGQASNLVGKTVTATVNGQQVTGVVSKASIVNGDVSVQVGDQKFPIGSISEISNGGPTA